VTGTEILINAGLAANLLIQIPLDAVHHCLGGSEIASSEKHEQPVGGRLKYMHLAIA
jgi:hypothetical protein